MVIYCLLKAKVSSFLPAIVRKRKKLPFSPKEKLNFVVGFINPNNDRFLPDVELIRIYNSFYHNQGLNYCLIQIYVYDQCLHVIIETDLKYLLKSNFEMEEVVEYLNRLPFVCEYRIYKEQNIYVRFYLNFVF